MTDLVDMSIRWRGDGDNVKVAGEFNNWEPQDLNKQEDGSWVVKLSLAPGKYMYKFVVGGEWVVNQDMPTVSDEQGNSNNQIEVEDGETSGDSDSWEKVSIPEGNAGEVVGGANGGGMQKIAVVERVFSLGSNFDDTLEVLKENSGNIMEEKAFTDIYYDTADFELLRKGLWLRNRVGVEEAWQLRAIVDQELKTLDDLDDVTNRLEAELGEKGVFEDIVKGKLQEMTRVRGKVSKWTVGAIEIEVRKEGEIETALVRVVGDIVASLKDLESSAEKLKLVSFNVPSLAAKLTGPA